MDRLGRDLDGSWINLPLSNSFIRYSYFFGTSIDDREYNCFHRWNTKKKGRRSVTIYGRKQYFWVKRSMHEAVS